MTTIPERIQAEAIQIAEDVRHRWRALGTDLNNDEPTWLPIAQALLAAEKRGREEERERCAVFLERFDPGDDNCRSVPAALDAASSAIRSTN